MAEITSTQNEFRKATLVLWAGLTNLCKTDIFAYMHKLMRHTVEYYWIFSHRSAVCGWQRCFTSGEYETNIIPSSKVTQCGWVSMLSFCLCVPVRVHLYEQQTGRGELWTLYLQYSPEWVFIFRRQKHLFTFQAILSICTWKWKQTNAWLEFRSLGRLSCFAVLYWRKLYTHKSCDDFI